MKKGVNAGIKNGRGKLPEGHEKDRRNAKIRMSLIEGYKEMSRINLSLAESALAADNDAAALGEQKLAECE